MSLNFTNKAELAPLAAVVRALQPVASGLGTPFFLMGAAARDLVLWHAWGFRPIRQTMDVDFAVMVEDWNTFAALRAGLIATGKFAERPGPATHRLRYKPMDLPLDIVPFGGVERADRTIVWPPGNDEVFDCFGAREALAASVDVLLPGAITVRVAPIPALTVLKIMAWQDRKIVAPGRDAGDIALYMRNYLDCGNMDRAAIEHGDLFRQEDFDHEAISAQLLGRDMAQLLDQNAVQRILGILLPETDPAGNELLSKQSGLALEHGRQLVAALCKGLADEKTKDAK